MTAMFHAGISGARGRMGRAVDQVLDARDDVVVAARFDWGETPDLSLCDVVIDFSTPEASVNLAKLAAERGGPALVIGSTGFTEAQEAELLAASDLQEKLIPSGYLPFLAFPERTPELKRNFLTRTGLDPAAKTLLYLPMGKPHGSWDVMAEKLLRQVPRRYNLIPRPHPSQSVTARLKDRLGFLRLQRLCRERGNTLLDLTSCKLSTLFAIGDLVIADGASAAEEALYYDLPLLFVEGTWFSPSRRADLSQRFPAEYIAKLFSLSECGMKMPREEKNVPHLIESSLAEADRYRPRRQAYFAWVFGDRDRVRQGKLIDHLRSFSSPQQKRCS